MGITAAGLLPTGPWLGAEEAHSHPLQNFDPHQGQGWLQFPLKQGDDQSSFLSQPLHSAVCHVPMQAKKPKAEQAEPSPALPPHHPWGQGHV